ncbi:hypothetical protein AUC43_11405 [Hymenobacter sedentarius]|uniref:Uncharacterized protein n=1 Tax=Hymenobacter sedentarius TaxID=1411621 RepID=A0A0U4C5T6_9BACT|nr:hypothetical protein AUC43_11405 [Hymenobacter sedentarius]
MNNRSHSLAWLHSHSKSGNLPITQIDLNRATVCYCSPSIVNPHMQPNISTNAHKGIVEPHAINIQIADLLTYKRHQNHILGWIYIS